MDKEFLTTVTEILKQNSYKYSLEGYITDENHYMREIFVYNCDDKDKIKKLMDRSILKQINIKESYSWYLGEKRKALVIILKKDVELSIPEFEAMQTDNYAEKIDFPNL